MMKKHVGFTLVELMITLLVLAIMVSIAVPSFNNMISRNQVLSTANDLLADIQFARSEAIKLDIPVTICSSKDGTTCSGIWADGWIVQSADNVISVREKVATGLTVANDLGAVLAFNGTGRPHNKLADDKKFTLTKGIYEFYVNIGTTGRPSVSSKE